MAGRKKLTGPLVGKEALTIIKTASGSHAYVYAGQPVPGDVADEELQRLYDEGFITDAPKVEVEVAVVTTATPATPTRSRGKAHKEPAAPTPETPETPAPAAPPVDGAESGGEPQAPEGETPPAAE